LTLKLRVGRKGYIILPKALREMVGLDEGDEVLVEVGDGITLKPVRRFNKEKLKAALKDHLNRIKNVPDLIEPEPGELAKVFLEVEFES
jgi:AbrB family looped-hinge helix DNA binding protein